MKSYLQTAESMLTKNLVLAVLLSSSSGKKWIWNSMQRPDHDEPYHLCLRMNYIQKARGAFKIFLCIGFNLGNVELKLLGKYYIKIDYLRFRKLVARFHQDGRLGSFRLSFPHSDTKLTTTSIEGAVMCLSRLLTGVHCHPYFLQCSYAVLLSNCPFSLLSLNSRFIIFM